MIKKRLLVSDKKLLKAYAKGDMVAFECLYARHKSALYRYLLRQTSQSTTAEDIAQEVWLAVISQADRFASKSSFKTWMYRIAYNKVVDFWRKQPLLTETVENEFWEALCDPATLTAEQRIELDQLWQALTELSPEQQTTILLKLEGFSKIEIAEITDTKVETVKSRIRYARQSLRLAR